MAHGDQLIKYLTSLTLIAPIDLIDSHAVEIRDTVKNAFVPHLSNISVDGTVADPPRPLAWYPDDLGWHYDVPRTLLKKSPEYAKFHQFLVAETEVGNISRQEAVSMIPPLLLDVQPQHWVSLAF